MAEVISKHYIINIDLHDARTVLENGGTAIMGFSNSRWRKTEPPTPLWGALKFSSFE
ncbi:hypothetical protein CCAN2_2060025 [Capnocytophaga canimorsus]|nr:hypothetical protein CCAN2_2060025 [Capnocytophaga canimorsus]